MIVQRQHHGFLHLRVFVQARFDFPQLNAQAANFHLMVDAAAVLNGPIGAIAGQVAGAVQALARAERIDHKALRCQPRPGMVAPGQTAASQVQLTDCTTGQRLQFGAQDIRAQVGNRATDGHAVAAFFDTGPVGDVDRGFGRAVQVVQRRLRQAAQGLALQFDRQRFTAAHNAPQRAALAGLIDTDKRLQHRRHKVQRGDRLFHDQRRQLLRVAVDAWRCHHQRGAVHQRPEKLPHRHVEAERCLLQHPVGRAQAIGLLHPCQTVIERAMAVARAFGAPGGAGGVNHVRQVLGTSEVGQIVAVVPGQPGVARFQADDR